MTYQNLQDLVAKFTQNAFNKEDFKDILTQIFTSIRFVQPQSYTFENSHIKSYTKLCEPLKLGLYKIGVGIFETTSIYAKITIHSEILKLLKISDLSGILCVFCENSQENSKNSKSPTPCGFGGGYENLENSQTSVNFLSNSQKNSQTPHEFRLSLITTGFDYETNKSTFSNLKRQSFILGHDKTHTAQKVLTTLISKAQKESVTLQDLETAFSQEPVSKEFYKEIKCVFDEIINTSQIPLDKQGKKEFAIKLLGRTLFIRFLKELSLVPNELFIPSKNYYQSVLAPLFFETLNTPINQRLQAIKENSLFKNVPYLNGGLFSPSKLDCYEVGKLGGFSRASIKDSVFEKLFKILQTYHFTIDEQSPIDQEVALDPELLGQIFENLLAEIDPNLDDSTNVRKATGSFYTPRNIVSFMCKNAIYKALKTKLAPTFQSDTFKDNLNKLFTQNEVSFSTREKTDILNALNQLKILDLFCGSGAFPLGILHEIINLQDLLGDERSLYERKLAIIKNQIYGVDIQPIAVEISRLRCFLSLIIESKIDHSKPNYAILPLPNLDFKFVNANSFIKLNLEERLDKDYLKLIADLKDIARQYFQATDLDEKSKLKENFYAKQNSVNSNSWLNADTARLICALNPFDEMSVAPFFDAELLLGEKHFDICIGNPPYISTKGKAHQANKSALLAQDGFFDDAYNHAFFRATQNLASKGICSLITPKTFWTINTKKNLRNLILNNTLQFICDCANPFYAAMVDTCITQFEKQSPLNDESKVLFIDATRDFDNPKFHETTLSIFKKAEVFFKPSPYNLAVFNKFSQRVNALMKRWWSKIETSSKITKNFIAINEHRTALKPGDLTLLGLITDGGQGLATANNGKFIGVLSDTPQATNAIKARAEKLFKAKAVWEDLGVNFSNAKDAQDFLNSQNEKQVRELFDNAKIKHGRDIFGQGFIYRIVSKDELADLSALNDTQKANGIESKSCFVPYDKGDKDGNRWYLPTPYYIEWSVENVNFLKKNSGKKGEGMPVVRNPQFYFKEGLCWSVVCDEFLKCRLKNNGVFDVQSMSLFSQSDLISDKFIICLINSALIGKYVKTFVNGTVAFQMNDARQIPIIIPNKEQLNAFEALFDEAYKAQKAKFEQNTNPTAILQAIQTKLDKLVYALYDLNESEIKLIESK